MRVRLGSRDANITVRCRASGFSRVRAASSIYVTHGVEGGTTAQPSDLQLRAFVLEDETQAGQKRPEDVP